MLKNRRFTNIYKNELDTTCFQYNIGYGSFKYEAYQRRHTLMICEFFDKKTCGAVKTKIVQNKELTEELNKPTLKNLKKETYIHLL